MIVLISEVSLLQGENLYEVGTRSSVLINQVSLSMKEKVLKQINDHV